MRVRSGRERGYCPLRLEFCRLNGSCPGSGLRRLVGVIHLLGRRLRLGRHRGLGFDRASPCGLGCTGAVALGAAGGGLLGRGARPRPCRASRPRPWVPAPWHPWPVLPWWRPPRRRPASRHPARCRPWSATGSASTEEGSSTSGLPWQRNRICSSTSIRRRTSCSLSSGRLSLAHAAPLASVARTPVFSSVVCSPSRRAQVSLSSVAACAPTALQQQRRENERQARAHHAILLGSASSIMQ